MRNGYHFVTRWRVTGTIEEVSDILGEATTLVRWWPSVYLEAEEVSPAGPGGIGREVRLHTRGWLPYTLRWSFRVTEADPPHGFTLVAQGDFDGRGIWTFEPDRDETVVTYDWKLSAEKPLLRYLSPVMKPIFAANHRWAMARGEESLRIELARRHATTAAGLAQVPAPPGPATLPVLPIMAAALGAAAAALLALTRLRRK